MKCAKHYHLDAVSTCSDCSKSLCLDCTEKFSYPICDDCNLIRMRVDRSDVVKFLILMISLFIVGFFFYSLLLLSFTYGILGGYLMASIPAGWSVWNRLTSKFTFFFTLQEGMFYLAVKLIASYLIGPFVAPFKLFSLFKSLADLKKLVKYTNEAG